MSGFYFIDTIPNRSRQLVITATMWAGLTAVSIFLFFFNPSSPANQFFPKCPFRLVTGWQCPGCGSTRALYQLLHLHTKDNRREFRAVTGGVIHQSGGAQRDTLPLNHGKLLKERGTFGWTTCPTVSTVCCPLAFLLPASLHPARCIPSASMERCGRNHDRQNQQMLHGMPPGQRRH